MKRLLIGLAALVGTATNWGDAGGSGIINANADF